MTNASSVAGVDVDSLTGPYTTAAQVSAATWLFACNARDAADFADLCDALDLPADRVSLTAVRKAHGKRRRKGGRR